MTVIVSVEILISLVIALDSVKSEVQHQIERMLKIAKAIKVYNVQLVFDKLPNEFRVRLHHQD